MNKHAFPYPATSMGERGMTLRDYFAAQAISGLCTSHPLNDNNITDWANMAYLVADAMMKAREQ